MAQPPGLDPLDYPYIAMRWAGGGSEPYYVVCFYRLSGSGRAVAAEEFTATYEEGWLIFQRAQYYRTYRRNKRWASLITDWLLVRQGYPVPDDRHYTQVINPGRKV